MAAMTQSKLLSEEPGIAPLLTSRRDTLSSNNNLGTLGEAHLTDIGDRFGSATGRMRGHEPKREDIEHSLVSQITMGVGSFVLGEAPKEQTLLQDSFSGINLQFVPSPNQSPSKDAVSAPGVERSPSRLTAEGVAAPGHYRVKARLPSQPSSRSFHLLPSMSSTYASTTFSPNSFLSPCENSAKEIFPFDQGSPEDAAPKSSSAPVFSSLEPFSLTRDSSLEPSSSSSSPASAVSAMQPALSDPAVWEQFKNMSEAGWDIPQETDLSNLIGPSSGSSSGWAAGSVSHAMRQWSPQVPSKWTSRSSTQQFASSNSPLEDAPTNFDAAFADAETHTPERCPHAREKSCTDCAAETNRSNNLPNLKRQHSPKMPSNAVSAGVKTHHKSLLSMHRPRVRKACSVHRSRNGKPNGSGQARSPLPRLSLSGPGMQTGPSRSSLNLGLNLGIKRDLVPRPATPGATFTSTSQRVPSKEEVEADRYRPKLPPEKTRMCGVSCVSVQTVAELIQGQHKDVVDNVIIVDCRFDYEYQGGHLVGAINVTTQKDLQDLFFTDPRGKERTALIVHCEYSQIRGPRAYRFTRELDRRIHGFKYFPKLFYPELHVMKGGYKAFFERYPHLCNPQDYVSMSDRRFISDQKLSWKKWRSRRMEENERGRELGLFGAGLSRTSSDRTTSSEYEPSLSETDLLWKEVQEGMRLDDQQEGDAEEDADTGEVEQDGDSDDETEREAWSVGATDSSTSSSPKSGFSTHRTLRQRAQSMPVPDNDSSSRANRTWSNGWSYGSSNKHSGRSPQNGGLKSSGSHRHLFTEENMPLHRRRSSGGPYVDSSSGEFGNLSWARMQGSPLYDSRDPLTPNSVGALPKGEMMSSSVPGSVTPSSRNKHRIEKSRPLARTTSLSSRNLFQRQESQGSNNTNTFGSWPLLRSLTCASDIMVEGSFGSALSSLSPSPPPPHEWPPFQPSVGPSPEKQRAAEYTALSSMALNVDSLPSAEAKPWLRLFTVPVDSSPSSSIQSISCQTQLHSPSPPPMAGSSQTSPANTTLTNSRSCASLRKVKAVSTQGPYQSRRMSDSGLAGSGVVKLERVSSPTDKDLPDVGPPSPFSFQSGSSSRSISASSSRESTTLSRLASLPVLPSQPSTGKKTARTQTLPPEPNTGDETALQEFDRFLESVKPPAVEMVAQSPSANRDGANISLNILPSSPPPRRRKRLSRPTVSVTPTRSRTYPGRWDEGFSASVDEVSAEPMETDT